MKRILNLFIIFLMGICISGNIFSQGNLTNEEYVQKGIDCMDGKLRDSNNELVDKEDCLDSLIRLVPYSKKAIPALIRHMNDKTEKDVIRRKIAEKIIKISQDKDVIIALRKTMNTPIMENDKKKLKESPGASTILQGVALISLMEIHDSESLPYAEKFLSEYNISAYGFANSKGVDKVFNGKCVNSMENLLKSGKLSDEKKVHLMSSAITSFNQEPKKYKQEIVDVIKNGDNKACEKLTYMFWEMKNKAVSDNESFYRDMRLEVENVKRKNENAKAIDFIIKQGK